MLLQQFLKKEHTNKTPAQTLFGEETGKYAALSFMKKFAEIGGENAEEKRIKNKEKSKGLFF